MCVPATAPRPFYTVTYLIGRQSRPRKIRVAPGKPLVTEVVERHYDGREGAALNEVAGVRRSGVTT